MKGYHCSSDSVNLRVSVGVCVCMCACVCVCWVSVWMCVWSRQHMDVLAGVHRGRGSVPFTPVLLGQPSGLLTARFLLTSWQSLPPATSWKEAWGAPTREALRSPFPIQTYTERKEERRLKSSFFFAPDFFFLLLLFPFEVARHSLKPHHTSTLNARESVMNMHQQSIWRWD